MKRKLLPVIAVIMMILLLLPIITSCSCTVTPGGTDTDETSGSDTGGGNNTGTDTGNKDTGNKDTGTDTGSGDGPGDPIKPVVSEAKSAPSLRCSA